jgi:hypothetical protein
MIVAVIGAIVVLSARNITRLKDALFNREDAVAGQRAAR